VRKANTIHALKRKLDRLERKASHSMSLSIERIEVFLVLDESIGQHQELARRRTPCDFHRFSGQP